MFKVMTWNVENLFRPGADGGPDTEAVYQDKLQGLATMIKGQAPTRSLEPRSLHGRGQELPDPNERKNAPSSDHAPVVETFANL